ncbi:unnamed protein product [Diamesa serratosioi]
MSQGLSASPLPNPDPQFSLIDAVFTRGAYVFNSIISLVLASIQIVFNGLVYVVVGVTQLVITTITVTNAVLANSFTALNTVSLNAIKVINKLVVEFNHFVIDDTIVDPPGIVFGSSLIVKSGENVEAISCGVQHLASVFTSMRAVPCNFGLSGLEAYPAPPATLPSQPNATVAPAAVAISIQARYALQIIQRLNSEISSAVQSYEDIRNGTGISCTQNCTLPRNLTNAYAYISVVLNAQVNSTLTNRLVTVFNASVIIQVNDALNRTRQFIDCIRANAECTTLQIRGYKNKPFVPLIDSLTSNTINTTQYSSSVQRIMKLTSDYAQVYIRALFVNLRSSKDRAFIEIESTRQSLITQITITLTAFNIRTSLIWDAVLMPKINILKIKLASIPTNLQLLFANMTAQRNASIYTIEVALNATYQSAATDVNKSISNLTNIILSDASSTTSNCQSFLEQTQGLQAVFAVEAGKCIVAAYQSTQSNLDNQTVTTKNISSLFNSLTGSVDKCFSDNYSESITWISYLATSSAKQSIATCLDTVIQQADAFIGNANTLASYANHDVPANANVSIATANECIASKANIISIGVTIIETSFNECKAAHAA